MGASTAGIDWPTVVASVVVPFALFAVGMGRYARLERSRLKNARTVSFGTAGVVALLALAVVFYAPSETAKVIGLLWAAASLAFGLRFSWLADKAEAIGKDEQAARESKLDVENKALHERLASITEFQGRELHNVRDRAQRLSNDLHSYTYANKDAGGAPNAVDLWAFRDRVLEVVHALEMHGITDNEVGMKLAAGYLDLDAFAHGLDRMVGEVDARHAASQNVEAALKRTEADLSALKADRRTNLLKRLFQVQSDVAGLTRAYNIAKITAETQPPPVEHAYGEALKLLGMEQDAVAEYRNKHEVEVMFLLMSFRQSGIDDVPELIAAMQGGCCSAADIDAIAKGLHLTINKVRVLNDW
jgi:hypothetical protein